MASTRSASNSFDSPSIYSLQDSPNSTPVAWARPVPKPSTSTSDISPEAVPLPLSPLASPRLQPTALPPLQHKPSRTVLSRGPFSNSSSNHQSTSTAGSRSRPTASARSTSDSDGSTISSIVTLSSAFPLPPNRSPFRYFPVPLASSYASADTTPELDPVALALARARHAQEARRRGLRAREQLYKEKSTPRKLKKKRSAAGGAQPRRLKRILSRGFDRLRGKKAAVEVSSISSPFAQDDLQKEELVKAFYRNGGRLEEEELVPALSASSDTPATLHIRRASPSPPPAPPPPLRRRRAKDYTPIPRRVRFAPKLSSRSAKKVINRGRPLPQRHSPGSGPLTTPRPRHNLLRTFAALALEDPSVDDEKEGWVDEVEGEFAVETPLPSGKLVWNSDEEDWSPSSPTIAVDIRASVAGRSDENDSSPTPGRWLSSSKLVNDSSLRRPLAPSSQSNVPEYTFDDLDPYYITDSVWPTGADGLPLIWANEEELNVVTTAQIVGVGTPALAQRASLSDIKPLAPFTQLSPSTSSRSRPLPPTPGPPVQHEWTRVASYRTTSYGSSQPVSLSASQSSSSHVAQEGQQIVTDQRSFHDEENQLSSPTTKRSNLHSSPPTRPHSPIRRLYPQDLPPPISPPHCPPPRPPTFVPFPSTPRLRPGWGRDINSPITLGASDGTLSSPDSPTGVQVLANSSLPSPLANRRSRPTPPRLFIPPRGAQKCIVEPESSVDNSSSLCSPARTTIAPCTAPVLGAASSPPTPDPTPNIPTTNALLYSPTTTLQSRLRRASSSLSLLNRSNSVAPSLIARHTKSVASFHPALSTSTIVEPTEASVTWEWEDEASSATMKGTPSIARTSVVAEGAFVESPKVATEREREGGKRVSFPKFEPWKPLKWSRSQV